MVLVVRAWLARRRTGRIREETQTLAQARTLIHELNESLCNSDFTSLSNVNHDDHAHPAVGVTPENHWEEHTENPPSPIGPIPVQTAPHHSASPCLGVAAERRCSMPGLLEEVRTIVGKFSHRQHVDVWQGIVSVRRLPRVSKNGCF